MLFTEIAQKGRLGTATELVDAVKDFLFELGMKPQMHLVKINIFQ